MRLNKFWFGFLLGFCPFIITESFRGAFLQRGYFALGGEFFTLILPVLVIQWRLWTIQNKTKQNKK